MTTQTTFQEELPSAVSPEKSMVVKDKYSQLSDYFQQGHPLSFPGTSDETNLCAAPPTVKSETAARETTEGQKCIADLQALIDTIEATLAAIRRLQQEVRDTIHAARSDSSDHERQLEKIIDIQSNFRTSCDFRYIDEGVYFIRNRVLRPHFTQRLIGSITALLSARPGTTKHDEAKSMV